MLKRGLVVNACLTGSVYDADSLFSYGPTATKLSCFAEASSHNPLMLWFSMNAGLLVNARRPAIDLSVYVADALRAKVTSNVNSNPAILDEIYRQMSQSTGMPLATLRKITSSESSEGVNLSPEEILALIPPYRQGFFVPGPGSAPTFQMLSQMPEGALRQTLAGLQADAKRQAAVTDILAVDSEGDGTNESVEA